MMLLQLPAVKSDNNLPYAHHESVKEMQEALGDVSRLRKIQEVYEMAERKFKQTFHTRWLSFEGAVDAVIINYDALLTCLEMEMTDVNLTQQTFTLEATLRSLQEMTTTPGPYLKDFLASLPDGYQNGFDFGDDGNKNFIKSSNKKIDTSEKIRSTYINHVIENLEARVTDTGIISNFAVLNPENLPQNATDLATYGDQQIHDLGKHYGPSNTNQQSPMTKTLQ
ncbi:hypothetical protein MAR_029840 [Mya arenaria]|uniref:Uncharacterized protein n=1 Tax=Mya arenaria TaxID=6604 RepID=A0ABY7DLD6_MYAAR|nr:hypothetical protein MAR_029840 [Mya arenaria]